MTPSQYKKRSGLFAGLAGVAVFLCLLWLAPPGFGGISGKIQPFPLPEFSQNAAGAWLNSGPMNRADLAGKVVLVDVWTFGCRNCYRSFPWLNKLEQRIAERDFMIVGIHSPEFPHEKERPLLADKIKEFSLRHPVMMDNDFAFWNALGNAAWPAYYLVDRRGQVRYRFYGETHAGDDRAMVIESAIHRLLDERAPLP